MILNLGDVSYNKHTASKIRTKENPRLPAFELRTYLSNISKLFCPPTTPLQNNPTVQSAPFFLASSLSIWLPVDIDCELSILFPSNHQKDHTGHSAILENIGGIALSASGIA